MKKTLLLAILASISLGAAANLNGDGYYRAQNAFTKRYAYLLDDKGSFSISTSSADVGALELYLGFTKASSDPATVFYLDNVPSAGSPSYYNISGQGTSIYGFLGEYVKILAAKEYDGQQAYYIYASKNGLTKYLGDRREDPTVEKGLSSVDVTGDRRLWYVHPMDAAGDESYFGIAPTLTAGGKYYYPLFASFPFSAYSQGMKFYTVVKVDPDCGAVVIKEITGTVPAAVPVIVECSNPLATDNRLNIGISGETADVSGNMLKGVYFDNSSVTHYNQTPYDVKSMRMLDVVNGELKFVQAADLDFLPRNMAYLALPSAEMQGVGSYSLMTEEDYNAYMAGAATRIPEGYYRMKNVSTGGYAALTSPECSLSDGMPVGALTLSSDLLDVQTDPATVMWMSSPEGSAGIFDRCIDVQGTCFRDVFGSDVKFVDAGESRGEESYYANVSGWYLGGNRANAGKAVAASSPAGDESRWLLKPVDDTDSDNYFCVSPSLNAGGKYYYPLYAGFPMAAKSNGMRFLIVEGVEADNKVAILREAEGVIPAGTPVIVECVSTKGTDNKIVVGAEGPEADVDGNMLSGEYFGEKDYDSTSMRVLAVKNGKLVFESAPSGAIQRNRAYLQLNDEGHFSISRLELMTREEYEQKYTGVETVGASATVDVYGVDGRLVRGGISRGEVSSLGAGLYILRSGNATEKILVK